MADNGKGKLPVDPKSHSSGKLTLKSMEKRIDALARQVEELEHKLQHLQETTSREISMPEQRQMPPKKRRFILGSDSDQEQTVSYSYNNDFQQLSFDSKGTNHSSDPDYNVDDDSASSNEDTSNTSSGQEQDYSDSSNDSNSSESYY